MNKDLSDLRKKIDEIKLILDLSSYCMDENNKKTLLELFDKLSYDYYKASMELMRSMNGDGEGI